MIVCPKCESHNLKFEDMLDVVEQVDEDGEFNYYTAVYRWRCRDCNHDFEAYGDYKERKPSK